MIWYRNLRLIQKIMIPVGGMLILLLGILTWQIQSKSSEAIQSVAERGLAAVAGKYGNEVRGFFELALNEVQGVANAIAQAKADGKTIPRETIISMLAGLEKGHKSFMASGSAWEANAYDGRDTEYASPSNEDKSAPSTGNDNAGRFIPYISSGELTVLEGLETSTFYETPKTRKRTTLTNPYFYTVEGKEVLMTTASAVIMEKNDFKGIVLIDIALDTVASLVEGISIYKSGWGAVITQNGTFVAHKNKSLVNTSLFDTPLIVDKDGVQKEMSDGKPFIRLSDAGEGMNFYYYYPMSLEGTGQTWYFMVSAPMAEVLEEAREISLLTLAICIGVLLCSLFLIFIVVRITIRPLGILADTAKVIAGGDLHVAIEDETFGGEMKELSSSLKEMIASLLENIDKAEAMSIDAQEQTVKAQEAMAEAEKARLTAENAKREGMLAAADQLENVVNIISSASEQLSAQIEESERGSSEQAARVAETATAMEEMNSTVMEVARNASAASDISGETRDGAENGARIVQGAVAAIQDVQEVSLALKEDMNTLAEQAQAITRIMSVISDIADQTNLLALNAAIEAARAGEAGRGFAVVADEVRKLAEKTMESTSEVGGAIKSVQESVTQSISRVDRTVDLIQSATEQASESGDALQNIVVLVDNTADQVRAIATASEEQSATSEEINRSVSHINDIAEQTSAAMKDAAQAVSELARQAQQLNRLIVDMKNS